MSVLVAAPASSANLGSGFDCAAVALDLWNELELLPGDGSVAIEGEGARELPRVAEQLDGAEVKRVVVVPDRLVNFVVAPR